ncbi:TetR/AcrR family transcriptional regulator C-terminal domain-containing protein [Nocardiopsis sp. NPDC007018]|uniref:TetR/AcrR family transcriptional regulator C-terminal domain-containing protein n=1 Tax=Nocardiopsis sp. NPDC007018 TaxID=3155721 RepID=UPI0033E977DC
MVGESTSTFFPSAARRAVSRASATSRPPPTTGGSPRPTVRRSSTRPRPDLRLRHAPRTRRAAALWPRLVHGDRSLGEEETLRVVDEAARTMVARYGTAGSA